MNSKKRGILFILSFCALFILGGALHVCLYGVDFADEITQIYFGFLILLWGLSIQNRIMDKRIKRFLLTMAILLVFGFVIQVFRYKLIVDGITFLRYCWYCYYIILFGIPLLFLYIAFCFDLPEDKRIGKKAVFFGIPCVIFLLLFITNDLHELIFIFKDEYGMAKEEYTRGILFYFGYFLVVFYNILSVTILLKKCTLSSTKKQLIFVPLFFIIGEVFLICSLFDFPKINDIVVWRIMETYSFIFVGLAESCIQIGLIPANRNYKNLFNKLTKPVIINNNDGECVYSSEGIKKSDNSKLKKVSKKISGGYSIHFIDTSSVDNLNVKLKNTTETIESRNEILKEENKSMEERSQIESRNRIYDNIATIVKPQSDIIKDLLHDDTKEFLENLPKINVYNAYIKRRSNLELLKESNISMPIKEIQTAVNESLRYLELCKFNTEFLYQCDELTLQSDKCILLYEFFEKVLETSLDSPCPILITMKNNKESIFLRMMFDSNSFDTNTSDFSEFETDFSKVFVTKDDESTSFEIKMNERSAVC